jgi:hypothetical protein
MLHTAWVRRKEPLFVSHFRETKPVFVCFSRGDEIHSCFEAAVELILVAAGVAGVIAAMMAGLS